MFDRNKERRRRRKDRNIKDKQREKRHHQRNIIIQDALIFEVPDFMLTFSGFQAGHTEMAAIKLHVAERTQESAAGRAMNRCFFLRMIKTTRFNINLQKRAGF